MEEDTSPVEHPLYWVNVLRGQVEAGQLHRLHRLLLTQPDEWIADFIHVKGLAGLFDVHENLFWRLYYNDSKGGKPTEEKTADEKEMFLACTDCFLPIFRSKAGINAVMKGNRSEVQEQVEQLILSLASKDQEAREKALWAVITIVGIAPTTDPRGRARLSEMAHTLWDGLGSLQILLEEKTIYGPLVNIIREARGPRTLALVGHVLALITLALEGLHPEIVSYEHIYSRNKLRNGFFTAGLTLAMEKQALQSQASADADALNIYAAALNKWKYCKTRDEKYSAALNMRKPKTAVPACELVAELPDLDAYYSFCEPMPDREERKEMTPQPRPPIGVAPAKSPRSLMRERGNRASVATSRPSGYEQPALTLPAQEQKPTTAVTPTTTTRTTAPPAATMKASASVQRTRTQADTITIEERKKRRGVIDDDDDELNNYKVLGDTNYVVCADEFLEGETERLQAGSSISSSSQKPEANGGGEQRENQLLSTKDVGGGSSPKWTASQRRASDDRRKRKAPAEDTDPYALALGEDEDDNDEKEGDEGQNDGEVVESYLSGVTAPTWKDVRESSPSSDRRERPNTQRGFSLGEYRDGRTSFLSGIRPGRQEFRPGADDVDAKGKGGERESTRRRRGAMSFVGMRQLQQRNEDTLAAQQQRHLKPERSVTVVRAEEGPPSADPYLDFLVSVTTARLANSGGETSSSLSKSTSPQLPPKAGSMSRVMLSASLPASSAQGPLYTVMLRQQMEVQQKRKRLDAESQPHTILKDGFRAGIRHPESTPHDLRSLASIVKRGNMCAWSVQLGNDHKTGLPVPVSVFDPVRVIIDETDLYIAPQTTTDTVLPTRIALSSIQRVREFRTASKDWTGKYGLTLEYMAGSTSRSEKVTLVAAKKKSQQWWMKAVIMNKGLLRDWNEEFQEAMTAYRRENINQQATNMGMLKGKDGRAKDQHDFLSMSLEGISLASLPISVRASLQVVDLVKEFTEIAEVIAQIIVDELHCPEGEKLIPPTQLGGMAGGEKYLSHGILFKFAIDSRGLYNGDEFAMKATQHEIKGLTAYINYSLNSNFPNTLHFPIMSVIDYKGFRLSATSILPVGPNTIVYGSADGSRTVHNKYKDMNALMKKAGRALNLKPHWITPLLPGAPKVLICGPGDIEGHLGTDGRFYVLDTARVFPPTTPTPEIKGSFLYRLMRPEFVKVNDFPLCSDAYSRWAHDPNNPSVLKQHNAEIVEATNHLINTVIPAFVKRLQAFFETIFIENLNAWQSLVEDMRVLVIDMHRAGINCRYMGLIRQHVTNANLRKSMLIEMVSRVLKNELRERMRNVSSSSEEENKAVLAQFFGQLLHDPLFWSAPQLYQSVLGFDVKRRLQERFPSCLTEEEQKPEWDLRAALHIGAVFARVNQLMGLDWTEEFEARLWRWAEKLRVDTSDLASVEELRTSIVKISPTVAQLPLVSFFAAKKYEKYADSPYASTKKQFESFLLKARDQYLLALEMKSDDVSILLNLASLFARLARCIEDQLHDPKTMAKMRTVEGFDMKYFRHRAHRFYQSADRQYQEALRIDSTRADLLGSYAAYLLTLPERVREAEKYYALAMQANPHNDELRAKYQRFQDDLHQRNNPVAPPDTSPKETSRTGMLLGSKTLRLKKIQSSSLKGSSILRLSSLRVSEPDDIVISSPQTMNRKLAIGLISGRSLHGKGGKDGGVSGPYCVLQLGQQVQRSTTKKKASSPTWYETFTFTITNAQEAVKLYVYDSGLFSQNCLGMRVLPISEIEAMNGHTGWYVLCASEGEPSDLALGEVRLHFQLADSQQ